MSFLPPMQDFTKRSVEHRGALFLFRRSGIFVHTEYCKVIGFLLLLSYGVIFFDVISSYLLGFILISQKYLFIFILPSCLEALYLV